VAGLQTLFTAAASRFAFIYLRPAAGHCRRDRRLGSIPLIYRLALLLHLRSESKAGREGGGGMR
jgi:hypothetical protein